MKLPYSVYTALLVLLTTIAQSAGSQTTIHNNSLNLISDSSAIALLTESFYQTLSFDKVDMNKYDSLNKFFTAQGLLISNVGKEPQFFTVKQYIESAKENFEKQQISTWNESEVCATTELFGKVAHRFSTYKIKLVSNGQESYRTGINAIQLIKQDNRWLITTVAWDKESKTLKIPVKYLCQ